MKTRTRRAGIGALALLTAVTWVLLPADGQEAKQASGSARYELMEYDDGSVQVLDRASGVIYAIKRARTAIALNAIGGEAVVRPIKLVKRAPSKGKPTWPKAGAGGPLRYHTLQGRRRWRRPTGVFDAQTGKVYLVQGLEKFLVLDPVSGTVEEGKIKINDPTGHGAAFNIRRNEAAAIGALKTIASSQSLFREGDKEGDTTLDYGSLKELGEQRLIDSILASGTKQGYRFAANHSPTTSEFLWWGTAEPVKPGVTGARYFAINHEGVIYYSTKAPIKVEKNTCRIPTGPDVRPVGR